MKRLIKSISLVLAVAFAATAFTACGNKEEVEADSLISVTATQRVTDKKVTFNKEEYEVNNVEIMSSANDISETVAETVSDAGQDVEKTSAAKPETKPSDNKDSSAKKRLVIATNAQFAPFEYYENGKLTGIDVDTAKLIAQKLGMECEFAEMPFDNITTQVKNGSADIGMAAFAVTDERLEIVNFSVPYMEETQVVVVKEGSEIKTLDGLQGKLIGVAQGSTAEFYAEADFAGDSLIRFLNESDVLVSLETGRIDAAVISSDAAEKYLKESGNLKVIDKEFAVDEYAVAVSKDNPELLVKINTAIAELKSEGKIDAVIAKHTH